MNAKDCALICQQAYARHKAGTLDFLHGAVRVILVHTGTAVVIAVAGTDDEETAEVDLDFLFGWSTKLASHVHRAVYNETLAAYDGGLSHIIQAIGSDLPVIVTGHSLGGGESEFICDFMALDRIPFFKFVSFNQPRVVVGGASERLIGDRSLCCRYAHDEVSLLPPLVPGFPWQVPNGPLVIGKPLEDWAADHSLSSCIDAAPTEEFEQNLR